MDYKINYPKSPAGREMIRRWQSRRDLNALIHMLAHGHIPPELVTALRDYRKGGGDLETLLLRGRRGKEGNASSRARAHWQRETWYAAILAAGDAGWHKTQRFDPAALCLVQEGFAPELLRLTPADRVKKLAGMYYRRRKQRRRLSPTHSALRGLFAGFMQERKRFCKIGE